jgi:hypothetical protein
MNGKKDIIHYPYTPKNAIAISLPPLYFLSPQTSPAYTTTPHTNTTPKLHLTSYKNSPHPFLFFLRLCLALVLP